MSVFKPVREKALQQWLAKTKRIRNVNDDFNDSIECSWQRELVPDEMHNSIFCSLGEWNSNITDIVNETGIDNLDFEDEEHRKAIFRYYTRLMLVVSEILTDFQDFLIYLKNYPGNRDTRNRRATKRFNDPSLVFSCKELFKFINNVCKHKIGNTTQSVIKYHKCNHHIDYTVKDDPAFEKKKNSLKVKNIISKKIRENMTIEIPSLEEVLKQVEYGYEVLDQALNAKRPKKRIRTRLSVYEKRDR
jgi:hypothetical protein